VRHRDNIGGNVTSRTSARVYWQAGEALSQLCKGNNGAIDVYSDDEVPTPATSVVS
jgi:hypothetical protein